MSSPLNVKKIGKSIVKIKDKIKKEINETVEEAKENEIGKKIADTLTILLIL